MQNFHKKMLKRSLFVLSNNADIIEACRSAFNLSTEAISEIIVLEEYANLSSNSFDGIVIVDPSFVAPLSVHEFTLEFLRENRSLVFLLTSGNVRDADGLARFVGAQAALAMPVDVRVLAEHLISPFGAQVGQKPDPLPEPDTAALSASISEILEGREPQARERFLQAVVNSDTGLYTPEFWQHRLEEEFKRSSRFRFPLGLVSFFWEGDVSADVLLELSGLMLLDTRDVDVASQITDHALVAMLPHTGLEGARMFSERVVESIRAHKLKDMLGESLEIASVVAVAPDSSIVNANSFLQKVLPQHDELDASY